MKIRHGFVSNSSSSSFIITNMSNEEKTLVDFIVENPQIIKEFRENFDWYKEEDGYTQEEMIKSAKDNNISFPPGDGFYSFSNEGGILVEHVLRYIYDGKSDNFKWKSEEEN